MSTPRTCQAFGPNLRVFGFVWFIGFIGFIGFTGFIGFMGFIGLIGLIGFRVYAFKGTCATTTFSTALTASARPSLGVFSRFFAHGDLPS